MSPYRFLLIASLCLAADHHVRAQSPLELELEEWASGLGTALYLTNCGDDRLFVVRQYGAINIITGLNTWLPTPFLDISSQVLYNGERGLLGMAFDPDYASNGHFYVNYTTGTGNGTTHISRFTVSADQNVADPASEVVMLVLPQPDPIHQSGSLMFGQDGYLYVALGDGGGASDPNDYGQNPTNIYGTVIRIDVQPDATYTIPPDNPFVGNTNGWREEIWAWGLRNPYRMDLDPANDDLWLGDVGQSLWEEIDYWPGGDNSGPNFGWRCYEGNNIFNLAGCGSASDYVFPVAEHAHSVNGGTFCAIVGGKVYRGELYPRLDGRYIYTDFCSGELRIMGSNGQGGWNNTLGLASGQVGLTGIGRDRYGELYATNLINGRIYKIKDRCPMPNPEITLDGSELVSTTAATYQWYLNGAPITGANGQVHGPEASGDYTVLAGFANGCSFFSDPVLYIITGLDEAAFEGMKVYPQPASERLTLNFGEQLPLMFSVVLRDVHGRAVRTLVANKGISLLQVDVSTLAVGPYVLEVLDGSARSLHRRTVSVLR